MRRRFQDIVPAMRYEAASDINHVADAVDAAKFPDGIEDHRIVAGRRMLLQVRTAHSLYAMLTTDRYDLVGAQ